MVDGEADGRGLMTVLLRGCGATVVALPSAAEALENIDRVAPTVLVCDIGMPGQDGHALIGALRARGSRVPAVAVTAYERGEDRERALRAGFQDYLVKPFDPAELVRVITRLVGGASSARATG